MSTGTLAVTTDFSAGNTISSSEVNTNFGDVESYINNRNDGTDEWQVVKVTATTTNAVVITGNQSTTVVSIDNTATDGDPVLTFQLGGVSKFTMGVDDGDADAFKIGTTAIGTSTYLEIDPAEGGGLQVSGTPSGNPTANTLYATNIIKGWVKIADSGTAAALDSFNVTSITDNGTGDYTVTWETDFGDADYAVVGMSETFHTVNAAQAAGTTQINTFNSSNAAVDTTRVSVVAVGAQ